MIEKVELGSAPIGENCCQVGVSEHMELETKECWAFKHQLERMFPDVLFSFKTNYHDFGAYKEVVAVGTDDESIDRAWEIQDLLPEKWDEEAIEELGEEYFAIIGRAE